MYVLTYGFADLESLVCAWLVLIDAPFGCLVGGACLCVQIGLLGWLLMRLLIYVL